MAKGKTAGLLAALVLLLAADALLLFMAGAPRLEDAAVQKEWTGLDLLKKYQENQDMIGWLQVDGTNISYPVMRGRKYLYRNFSGERDASGSLFVEEDWTEQALCTLIYGHNMWMYGTMLNPLHQFIDEEFFRWNRTIRFYVIRDSGQTAEKRTFGILCCCRTRVDEWNYANCQNIRSGEELDAFAGECKSRAVRERETEGRGEGMIVLSTCSYHTGGGKGRILVVGELVDRIEQSRIDPIQPAKTD